MICSKCGTENSEHEMFCRECGAELYSGENVSSDTHDKKKSKGKSGFALNTKKKKSSVKVKKEENSAVGEPEKQTPSDEKKKTEKSNGIFSLKTKIKIVAGGIAALAVIVAAILISGNISAKKGERIAAAVPLGRNIDFCIKETGEDFSATSRFKDMRTVSAFNYICESDKTVNISGITVPTWAVLVNEDSKNILNSVEYYNFAALREGWKGEYSSVRFTKDTVQYGMDEKTVTKTIGFEPYYTQKTSDNKSVSCYRYYIIDNETGNDRVYNYFVEYNDLNGTVVNAYDTEINYVNYILGIS